MNKTEFDETVKKAITDNDIKKHDFGYCTLPNNDQSYGNNIYDFYYSNKEFNEFCSEMKEKYQKAFRNYNDGKGKELKEHHSRYGIVPPKMASVASSSRFCYLSLRDASISDFGEKKQPDVKFKDTIDAFEKDLKVEDINGTNPQMDAFIETNDTAFFFEFKCHEIFDPHKKTLSRQYDDNYLNKWGIKRNHEEIPYSEFGLDKIKLFDLKQFITHMVGIVNFSDSKNKRIVFSYVYFKPDNADQNIYKELKEEVKAVFNSKVIKKICNENNIELRLYFYKNNIMDGFEKEKKPTRINLDE